MERPESVAKSETPTNAFRWFSTYDLDNLRGMVLQQKWIIIITFYENGVVHKCTEEWRNIEVVDGGLRV